MIVMNTLLKTAPFGTAFGCPGAATLEPAPVGSDGAALQRVRAPARRSWTFRYEELLAELDEEDLPTSRCPCAGVPFLPERERTLSEILCDSSVYQEELLVDQLKGSAEQTRLEHLLSKQASASRETGLLAYLESQGLDLELALYLLGPLCCDPSVGRFARPDPVGYMPLGGGLFPYTTQARTCETGQT
jgi:hypothetical protein